MMKTKLLLMLTAVTLAVVLTAGSASAELLVYEPFDYPDAPLNGNGGALGTTGTWTTNDTGEAQGWWCHPEGELTGQGDDRHSTDPAALNLFDGTVDNLATSGGFVGPAGPTDQSTPGTWGTRDPTGNLDANIGLDPSVTATFQSGTTTWFSYVASHADNRNQGSPTFMICTDPTTNGSRGLTMQNSGNGIGGVGGPPRFNLFDVYPHYFSGGVHHQTPGGYLGGVLGGHNGIVTAFCSSGTCDGVLGDDATRAWVVRDDDGYMGVPNIVVGKIEWDADTGGYDIISVVSFLETDELSEAAFDAIIADKPLLSSKNWPAAVTPADPLNPSNKPDLDQSQFDLINISSLKFWIDEIRIGTTFNDVIGAAGAKDPSPANGATVTTGNVDLSWTNAEPNSPSDSVYVDVWFGTEPNETHPGYDMTKVVTAGQDTTNVQVSAPTEGTYYWQVNSYIYGADLINEPNMIAGSLWSFNAVADAPPSSVVIDTPDMITWSGEPVSLDATVVDDGASALTYAWSANPSEGVVFVPSAAVEDPTVTITKDTDNPSIVTLTLAVNDEGNPTPVEDTMDIDVYDDACQAALGTGLTIAQTDFDANCITDIRDFAVLAAKWLDDYKATAPIPRP